RNVFSLVFQIHQKFGVLSALGIVEVAARFAAVVVFWRFSALTIQTALLSYAIAAVVPILVAVPWIMKTLAYFRQAPPEPGGVMWPILARHGKWQMGLDIASSMISNVKYWLIKIFLSTEAVAVFSVAQSMYSAVASLLPLKSVMFPIIAEHSGDIPVMRALVQRSTKYSLVFYFGLLIFSVLIAPPFIAIFFPKYLIGIFIFQLMALRLPLNAFSISQAPLLVVLKEQRYLFFLSLVNAASMLLFLPLLMATFGLPGVVIEWLITVLIVIVLREIFLRRKHQLASVSIKSFFTIDQYDHMLVRRIIEKLRLSKLARPLLPSERAESK
ncbi:MAG: oligosaccharide flippase family protein, partial [Patescibacteria group bacterium]